MEGKNRDGQLLIEGLKTGEAFRRGFDKIGQPDASCATRVIPAVSSGTGVRPPPGVSASGGMFFLKLRQNLNSMLESNFRLDWSVT